MNISCRLRIILKETSMKGGEDLGRDEGLHPPILNLGRLHIITISYIQQISYITPSNIEPGQAAYQEGGDDGDEHQSKSLLPTSATSSLSHLIIISFPNRHLRQDDVF